MKKVSIVTEKNNISRHVNTFYPEQTINSFDSSDIENNNNFLQISNNSQPSFSQDQKNTAIATPDSTLITGYNSHLRSRLNHTDNVTGGGEANNITIGVFPNDYTQPRRHMYSKASDRSDAINARILRMARKWTSLESSPCSFEELANPGYVSPVNKILF